MARIVILCFCLIQGILMFRKSKKDETISEKVIEFNLAKGTRGNTEEEVIRWIQSYRRNVALIFIVASIILLVMVLFSGGEVVKIGF